MPVGPVAVGKQYIDVPILKPVRDRLDCLELVSSICILNDGTSVYSDIGALYSVGYTADDDDGALCFKEIHEGTALLFGQC